MSSANKIRKKDRYHHGDLRAQLVEATRQLVEEKGPDHFSVSEACRVAGVSTAAPYRHFRDKEEMLVAVTLEGMDRKYQKMLEAVEAVPSRSLDRVIALGRVYVEFAQAEPGVFRLIFGNTKDHRSHETLMSEGPRHYGYVESVVAETMGKTQVDDDVRKRSFMLWTFVHGLSFLLIDEKVRVTEMTVDIESLLHEVAVRVLSDRPPH